MKMFTILNKLSKKQMIWFSVVLISLILFAVLTMTANSLKASLDDQRAALRWSEDGGFAQVSCYFADSESLSLNDIMSFRNQIGKNLREASFANENSGGRLYIDAYSSIGEVTIKSNRSSLDTKAIGIGGDFFLFHPLHLVSGAYFSGHDLMKDAVILDEEAAWQLFGSSDIAGMPVMIGGVPHYVRGVIRRESGRLWAATGLNSGVAYISAESLAAYGRTAGIQQYEIVMPNPVTGFAYRVALEKFGYNEAQMLVVDNSARFGLEPLIKVIAAAGTRSMQSDTIRFPYWENYARGFEDILAFMLVFQGLFLGIAGIVGSVMLFLGYRRRTWTWKGVLLVVFAFLKKSFEISYKFIHKKLMKKRIV